MHHHQHRTTTSSLPHRIILDCDPGIDDAMAILLALSTPGRISLEALTIVHGNHENVELLAANARKIVRLVQDNSGKIIPVYVGAKDPIMRPYHGHGALDWHGKNGLGDVVEEYDETVSVIEGIGLQRDTKASIEDEGEQHHRLKKTTVISVPENHQMSAAAAIINLCVNNPGEITIVTIGPQTNLALALKMEPNLPNYVRKVCMMGGCFNARGNVSPVAEANVFNDPEATRLVLKAGWEVVVAPLDVTTRISMNEQYLSELAQVNRIGDFLNRICQFYLNAHRRIGINEIHVHDAAIIMYLIQPDLFQSKRAHVDVELSGELTKGQTVAYWGERFGDEDVPARVEILLEVNHEAFLRLYKERIASFQ